MSAALAWACWVGRALLTLPVLTVTPLNLESSGVSAPRPTAPHLGPCSLHTATGTGGGGGLALSSVGLERCGCSLGALLWGELCPLPSSHVEVPTPGASE